MLEKIKFNPVFLCKTNKENWEHFLWSIQINDVSFEYKTGIAHFTPYYKESRSSFYGSRNKKPVNGLSKVNLSGWLHVPTKEDVLYCLFSDSHCADQSFDNFCDDLGYSNDSINDFNVYRHCAENFKKLKEALGTSYREVESYVQELDL